MAVRVGAAPGVCVLMLVRALLMRTIHVAFAVRRVPMPMAVLMAVMVLVAVVPELGLVEEKEEHEADEEHAEERMRAGGLLLHRLGQQVHERRGQQGARCEAEKVLLAGAAPTRGTCQHADP